MFANGVFAHEDGKGSGIFYGINGDGNSGNSGNSGDSSGGHSNAPIYVCQVSPNWQDIPKNDFIWGGYQEGDSLYTCSNYLNGVPTGGVNIAWYATPPPTVDPGAVAQQIVDNMPMKAITIGMVPEAKPGTMGYIGLPTWMWAERSPQTTGPQTDSLSLAGTTVTVTATLNRVVWTMGDGTQETCTSPGTPYTDADQVRPSPDCGHLYKQTSDSEPGGVFAVSAVSYWDANWAANTGPTGVINVDFTSRTTLRVGEMQVLRQ